MSTPDSIYPNGYRYRKHQVDGVESGFVETFSLASTDEGRIYVPLYLTFTVQNRSASSIDLELVHQIEDTDSGEQNSTVLNRKEFVTVQANTVNDTFGPERFPETEEVMVQPNRQAFAGYDASRDEPDCDLTIYYAYNVYNIPTR